MAEEGGVENPTRARQTLTEPQEKVMTRRKFLEIAGEVAAALVVGGYLRNIRIPVASGASGQVPPPSTPVPIEKILSETKVAVKARGADTSFVERGPWTKERFKELRPYIFAMQFDLDSVGNSGRPTGVLIDCPDKEKYCILTTDHGFLKRLPKEVAVFRPGIDKTPSVLHPTDFRQDPIRKTLVFTGERTKLQSVLKGIGPGVEWRDGFILGDNPRFDSLLTLTGVPFIFGGEEGNRFSEETILLGTVILSKGVMAANGNAFALPAEDWWGGSGGPLFALDYSSSKRGIPAVVGLAMRVGTGLSFDKGDPLSWYVEFENLNVNILVKDIPHL